MLFLLFILSLQIWKSLELHRKDVRMSAAFGSELLSLPHSVHRHSRSISNQLYKLIVLLDAFYENSYGDIFLALALHMT